MRERRFTRSVTHVRRRCLRKPVVAWMLPMLVLTQASSVAVWCHVWPARQRGAASSPRSVADRPDTTARMQPRVNWLPVDGRNSPVKSGARYLGSGLVRACE
eukprot:354256-Chlamydomonas_euryale.AAC.4